MVLVLAIIITIVSQLYIIIGSKYFKRRFLIKKTVDDSNSGIIALKNKDKVMFQNSIMYNLMENLNIHNDYIWNIKERSIEEIGQDYLVLIDKKAWLFCISKDEKEITAFDIDEEYKLQNKLKKQNEQINKNNEEILWTIENLEELEREEKTLKIKNKFHDLLGQNLSILRAYLNQEVVDKDKLKEVKFMIKKMFTELEDTDDIELNLQNLIKINENIGIKIKVNGNLPQEKEKAKVLFEIIREAVTNAIRHANSTEINVLIEDKLSGTSMHITNNGNKPKETIIENEGIKGMRRKVKSINGSMYIQTVPEFSIQVDI